MYIFSNGCVLQADASYDYLRLQGNENTEFKVQQLQVLSCIYGSSTQTASTVLLLGCKFEVFTYEVWTFEVSIQVKDTEGKIF